MKKILAFLLCFATLVALFSIKNADSKFSFEQWLTNVSEVSDNRPTMPTTDNITKIWEDEEYSEDGAGIVKVLTTIKNIFVTIYECLVFAIKFLVYIVEYILYLSQVVSVVFYNLFVW